MVAIDLHVHTAFGSPCAELHKPGTLIDTMKKRLIHGMVITEHNTMWPKQDIDALNRSLPEDQRIYSGIEVSTSRHHVVVIGLDDSSGIFPGMVLEKLLEISRKNNAVTILVHPFNTDAGIVSSGLPAIDCIEVASTMTIGEKQQKTCDLCLGQKAIPVAGSDAHCRENIGKAYTAFPRLPRNEKELAEQIRKGFGIPMFRGKNGKGIRAC